MSTTVGVTRQSPSYSLWHPFADMGSVEHQQMLLTRGEGAWVWDDAGRRYLDGTSALWYANLGHGRPEIAEAVARQLRELDAFSTFGDYANEPAIELAHRLSGLAPMQGSRVFLGSGGGDMIDAAAKIARSYHVRRGEATRVHLIGRTNGYHGTHGVGTSIAGIPANREGFGPLFEDASTIRSDDAEALEEEILRVGPERVAAFFCEPVIGAGGVHLPAPGYIETVSDICRRHGVLFIADCVIVGFGRVGTWMGIDRWPVEPDLIVLAKALSGGTQPIGALLVASHVAKPFFPGEPGAPVLRHGQTYAGHPACCAAANVAMDLYEREGLIERGRMLEQPLADALSPLADHPLVQEVRAGLGFLAGIDLKDEVRRANPGVIGRWQLACREAGALVRPVPAGIAVSPPLICGEEEIEGLAAGIMRGLELIESSLEAVSL